MKHAKPATVREVAIEAMRRYEIWISTRPDQAIGYLRIAQYITGLDVFAEAPEIQAAIDAMPIDPSPQSTQSRQLPVPVPVAERGRGIEALLPIAGPRWMLSRYDFIRHIRQILNSPELSVETSRSQAMVYLARCMQLGYLIHADADQLVTTPLYTIETLYDPDFIRSTLDLVLLEQDIQDTGLDILESRLEGSEV